MSEFGRFDFRISRSLKREIRKAGENPSDFQFIIDVALSYVKEELSTLVSLRPELILERWREAAVDYINRILDKNPSKLKRLTNLLRMYGSYFLVGAGVSFEAELPLAKYMGPLVYPLLIRLNPKTDYSYWRSYCEDEKGQIKNCCWEKIKNNKDIFRNFKLEFKKLNDSKKKKLHQTPSLAHRLIIKYFIARKILELICLNWDNLLEQEYKNQKRIDIKKITTEGVDEGHFWKLNGDVDDIDEYGNVDDPDKEWILPHEGGRIFASLIDRLNSSTQPIFVVIGYSEQDMNISNNLLNKVTPYREKFTIRPDINPFTAKEYEIPGTATYAMKKIDQLLGS